ncbi:MAG: lipoxygenase family protein [Enhygromyxa sp.]
MLPSLPQQDPSPGARRAALARARAVYILTHAYQAEVRPQGTAVAATVPPADQFAPCFDVKVAAVDARLLANHALLDLEALGGNTLREINGLPQRQVTIGDWLGLTRSIGTRHRMFGQPFQAAGRIAQSFPPSVEFYKEVFLAIPRPPVVELFDNPMLRNKLFGWYRLAGNNPFVIQGIRKIPKPGEDHHGLLTELAEDLRSELTRAGRALEQHLPRWAHAVLAGRSPTPPPGQPADEPPDVPGVLPARFPVTNEIYQRVMGPEDTLERAAAERRLYLADYRLCDNLPPGTWSSGSLGVERKKYVYAPMALFAWRPETDDEAGEFVPVAIQCHQRATPTRPNPIFTPLDGVRWDMAVAVVQSAEASHHEMVWHLGRSHMVMEAVYLCARRTLAPQHPLMILLAQHCEFTLAINDYAAKHLIAPGGQVDVLFGSTLSGTLTIMARALEEYRLDRASPPDQAVDRLIDDRRGLPEFPFRDDAATLWEPFARWIDSYVRLYYARPQDIAEDTELADFLRTLADPQGGNLRGVPTPESVAALGKFIATLCWIGSAQHSALNYTQFPYMAYPPTMPLALYAEAPTAETPQNQLNWSAMLAPVRDAVIQSDIAYQLSGVKWRAIGHYSRWAFRDPRVQTLLARLYRDFDVVESQLRDRDRLRFMSYPYLFPSNAQNSIFM